MARVTYLKRICDTTTHSPLIVALVIESQPAHITFLMQPTWLSPLPGSPSLNIDDRAYAVSGMNEDASLAVHLPYEATARVEVTVENVHLDTRNAVEAAGGTRQPLPNDGNAHSTTTHVRQMIVLPQEWYTMAATMQQVTIVDFYDLFIAPLTTADPVETAANLAKYEMVIQWWSAVSGMVGGNPVIGVDCTQVLSIVEQTRLAR